MKLKLPSLFIYNTKYLNLQRSKLKTISLIKFYILIISLLPFVGGNDGWKIIDTAKSIGCSVLGIECCRPPYFNSVNAMRDLHRILRNGFFGQHIVVETVTRALDAHLRDDNPGKALVFSFHGWAGSGKTYLSELIARALYKKGLNSKFAKFFMASLHFPDENNVSTYKAMVKKEIIDTLKNCEHAMFVFDEVDKTPPGVFDAVMPFIDYPGLIEGLEHKKSIFIFLSNTGSNDITSIALNAWKQGKSREELTFNDFEEYLSKESFNKKATGLYRSNLIDRVLVDYFIPFLPMERKHIVQCAKVEVRRLSENEENVNLEEIANSLTYWPADIKLYSQTGCKKVEGIVKYHLSAKRYAEQSKMNQDDDDEENNYDENSYNYNNERNEL